MYRFRLPLALLLGGFCPILVEGFVPSSTQRCSQSNVRHAADVFARSTLRSAGISDDRSRPENLLDSISCVSESRSCSSRRNFFHQSSYFLGALATSGIVEPSLAEESPSSATAEVTDRIYIELRGLDGPASTESRRLVIGLFGKEAPKAVGMLKQLVSSKGLPAPCKPKEEGRALQKDQLTANKVYNSCKENEDKGVNYEYGTVWRIIKDQRIDVGSVSGKFIAREYPEWTGSNALLHDSAGVVSVRKGSTSGFGFTIYPGGKSGVAAQKELDEQHLVVGRVLEGMDVINKLNGIPVVASSKVNYMGLTGGPSVSTAPSRGCYYGGPMYCNENKPLQKVSIYATGSL